MNPRVLPDRALRVNPRDGIVGVNVERNKPLHLLRRVAHNAIASRDLLLRHSGSDAEKQDGDPGRLHPRPCC
jgi:hypothetical protein